VIFGLLWSQLKNTGFAGGGSGCPFGASTQRHSGASQCPNGQRMCVSRAPLICCRANDEAGTAKGLSESNALLSTPLTPSDFEFGGGCDFNFLWFLVCCAQLKNTDFAGGGSGCPFGASTQRHSGASQCPNGHRMCGTSKMCVSSANRVIAAGRTMKLVQRRV